MKRRRAAFAENSSNVEIEIRDGSPVIVQNQTRHVFLASLLPLSSQDSQGRRIPIDFRVYLEAAGYLALKDFNARQSDILPHLPDLLGGCNIQIGAEFRDTQFNVRTAVQQLQPLFANYPSNSVSKPLPFALLGAARSAVSQTLSFLGTVYELPQISATSTSAELDNKLTSTYFTRTVPSNAGDAKSLAQYLSRLQSNVTHLGIIYVRDSFGFAFHESLIQEMRAVGIKVESTSYNNGEESSIYQAVNRLKDSGIRYFFGVFNPQTWKTVIRSAEEAKIIGQPGYTWLLSEASLELTQPGFRLSKEDDADIARAIHGAGVVLLDVPTNPNFDASIQQFSLSSELQEDFVSLHADSFIFDGFQWDFPGSTLYQYLNYDAVMSLGVAACRTQEKFFTGTQFHQTLIQTEFEGASGYVSFDQTTGTRKAQDLRYRIQNVLLDENYRGDEDFGFLAPIAVQVDLRSEDPITVLSPFVYSDNTTQPHESLPPVHQDMNLIEPSAIGVGLGLGAVAMVSAVAWCIWTFRNRNADVIRIAQPVFLGQVCVGIFIIGCSVIPMSLQEPIDKKILDIACMAGPWMQSLGFVTTFSALAAKTRRLNALFNHGKGFRRMQVKARDVLYSFLVLLSLNLAVLVVWTVVAPLRWTRKPLENYDSFGRSVESVGSCLGDESYPLQLSFLLALVGVNLCALCFANYQCYKARGLPTDFNESFYVAATNASLLETMIVGGPILAVVDSNPTAGFLVRCILVFLVSSSVLLLMFVPKYQQRKIRRLQLARGRRRSLMESVQAPRHFSTVPLQAKQDEERNSAKRNMKHGESVIRRNEDYYVLHGSSTKKSELESTSGSFTMGSVLRRSNVTTNPDESGSSRRRSFQGRRFQRRLENADKQNNESSGKAGDTGKLTQDQEDMGMVFG